MCAVHSSLAFAVPCHAEAARVPSIAASVNKKHSAVSVHAYLAVQHVNFAYAYRNPTLYMVHL